MKLPYRPGTSTKISTKSIHARNHIHARLRRFGASSELKVHCRVHTGRTFITITGHDTVNCTQGCTLQLQFDSLLFVHDCDLGPCELDLFIDVFGATAFSAAQAQACQNVNDSCHIEFMLFSAWASLVSPCVNQFPELPVGRGDIFNYFSFQIYRYFVYQINSFQQRKDMQMWRSVVSIMQDETIFFSNKRRKFH